MLPDDGGASKFQGFEHGTSISLFVVRVPTGLGPDRHHHPYEEVLVIPGGRICVAPANAWHEFKNRADGPAHMVNIHPVPQTIQEDWP